ncbi:MAG: hypothetical protein JOZ82_10530 [Marmoricola sp.]|nr:hypothetical protein [Marmoricola sp.]
MWQHFRVVFTVLTVEQQWALHRYYQTQREARPAELLEARAKLARKQLSLPHRAGRAYARLARCLVVAHEFAQGDDLKLHEAIAVLAAPVHRNLHPEDEEFRPIAPLGQPEPDAESLAKAILLLVEQLQADVEHEDDDRAA